MVGLSFLNSLNSLTNIQNLLLSPVLSLDGPLLVDKYLVEHLLHFLIILGDHILDLTLYIMDLRFYIAVRFNR